MQRKLVFIVLVLACLALFSCAAKKPDTGDGPVDDKSFSQPAHFMLGEGDEIELYVWRHEDLERSLKIDPAGYVAVPFAGEVKASGLTVAELRQKITRHLEKYLKNPQVDINVASIRSRQVYIFGEVSTPGSLVLDKEKRVLAAISQSGGFTNDADKEKVLLLRKSENGEIGVHSLDCDFKNASVKLALNANVYLKDGDILFVPPLKIASFERFMVRLNNILNPFISVEQGIALWPDVSDALKGEDNDGDRIYIGN